MVSFLMDSLGWLYCIYATRNFIAGLRLVSAASAIASRLALATFIRAFHLCGRLKYPHTAVQIFFFL